MQIKRALISVSDKTGLEKLVKTLDRFGVEIMSTGGTAKVIASFGVKVREVTDYTVFPEMLEGRVKTLHPKVHAALLALRENSRHMRELDENEVLPIDMVVVNLYPFEKVSREEDSLLEEALRNIDIGGPAILRSGAKNFKSVAVISSISQYKTIGELLEKNNCRLKEDVLKTLASAAFDRISIYDAAIGEFLSRESSEKSEFPPVLRIKARKVKSLRYGENPHQAAAFYSDSSSENDAPIEQMQGKELSFNNIMDVDSAYNIVSDLTKSAACIVKHNNPCGAAQADSLTAAYLDALACDRMSAFGGIIAFNRSLDKQTAEVILNESIFIECIAAPGYEEGAVEVFRSKKNVRVLKMPRIGAARSEEIDLKKVRGGFLVQKADMKRTSLKEIKVVTKKKVPKELLEALLFSWRIVKHVKSNAIVLAAGTKTVGIGAGQMSRVDSVRIAIEKSGGKAAGAVLASDAFFPQADSIELAHEAGISAIIQPGGSIRDKEVIEAADRSGIPMVFTGVRHFKH
ncbi:MAG: bifunctional phosphoribosylaminoimidazolecarboxamide formyltransferase/IMP cyclohydrolase [Candidatus Omnitrophica bacterium]|nr:bifunctional phosphoribosylaminoimidazolecarboxamide formyltransferase/IMP cyclohydrolase [Candidatus Omnitrophota bacterium]